MRKTSALIDSASNFVWTASWMRQDTQVACQSCQSLLVKDSVKTWKDLPSENWAEMMDFWHCHKPDTEDPLDHKATGPLKGYGAANGIGPTAGVALVDAMYIHLLLKDCNVTLTDSPKGPKVWIFNTNIIYSSTLVPESPKQALKVYYKYIADSKKVLEQESLRVDELQLPNDATASLCAALDASTRLLPISARKFQEWTVGFLER
ncbi:MAG: hypothetical protein Q9184_006697 [Pyrenodesmia sp. 2 TL-2023]